MALGFLQLLHSLLHLWPHPSTSHCCWPVSASTASAAAKQAMLGQGATACGSYTGVLDEHLMSVLSLPEPAQSALLQDLAVKSSLSVPPKCAPPCMPTSTHGWPHPIVSQRLVHLRCSCAR
jgi:hypothetical protein